MRVMRNASESVIPIVYSLPKCEKIESDEKDDLEMS